MEVLWRTQLIFLAKMIASLLSKNNHTIPGFYDNVEELSTELKWQSAL
jgi:hypothetical protein